MKPICCVRIYVGWVGGDGGGGVQNEGVEAIIKTNKIVQTLMIRSVCH